MATYRKRKNGKHQFIVRRVGHDPISKTFDVKAEGKAWAAEIETKLNKGGVVDTQAAKTTMLTTFFTRSYKGPDGNMVYEWGWSSSHGIPPYIRWQAPGNSCKSD